MNKIFLPLFIIIIFITGCYYQPPLPIKINIAKEKIDYLTQVKPILDNRCVSCHSCYNSPCQLKLSSYDGLIRGASKAVVYDGARLKSTEQTRLFIDGHSEEDWRKKDFFSVIDNNAANGLNDSIMLHLIQEKVNNPIIKGEYRPETEDLICSKNQEEVSQYLTDKNHRGMPYGFPNMSDEEFNTLKQWLAQGAKGPTAKEVKDYKTASKVVNKDILKWEKFLNKKDNKHILTARYLYEHLYLGHINFTKNGKEFFELVRSTTPSPKPIDIIPTIRPYDDPKVEKFYYRFRKIYSTIVHKTHMVITLDDAHFNNVKNLFINTPWMEKTYLVGYNDKRVSNPFLIYAQIPPKVRYQYLLDNAHFIIKTFIRGPVCRGQIALSAINDHFWVLFQDPKYDIGVQRPSFLIEQANNLSMPIEMGSDAKILKTFSDKYLYKYSTYFKEKTKLIKKQYPQGLGIESIYKGKKADDAPMMTIYRHFDSASVHKGAIGPMPKTTWVIDYSHLERIYYNLVAGFDVFGNVSHQVNIRRYMDFLRNEGEFNFIAYLPKDKQLDIYKSWNKGDNEIAQSVEEAKKTGDFTKKTKIKYKTNQYSQEFIEQIVYNHLLKSTNIKFDNINYYSIGHTQPKLPTKFRTDEDIIDGFRALTKAGTGFISHIVDFEINVMHLRLNMKDGRTVMGTIIVNRWHDNVSSLIFADKTLDSTKDTLDFHLGLIGSYPNMFLVVDESELPDFFDMLQNFKKHKKHIDFFEKFGISRSDKNFWKHYDWFQDHFNKSEPVHSGLLDLNRYYHTPW